MFFTKEDRHFVPLCEQIFRGEGLVVKEINKIEKFKSPSPDEVYPRVIKTNVKRWLASR